MVRIFPYFLKSYGIFGTLLSKHVSIKQKKIEYCAFNSYLASFVVIESLSVIESGNMWGIIGMKYVIRQCRTMTMEDNGWQYEVWYQSIRLGFRYLYSTTNLNETSKVPKCDYSFYVYEFMLKYPFNRYHFLKYLIKSWNR